MASTSSRKLAVLHGRALYEARTFARAEGSTDSQLAAQSFPPRLDEPETRRGR